MNRSSVSFCLAVLAALGACHGEPPAAPDEFSYLKDWQVVEELTEGNRICSRMAGHMWRIAAGRAGPLAVAEWGGRGEPMLPFDAPGTWSAQLQVGDGWILGSDHGEWGGEIWWASPNGERRERLIKEPADQMLMTSSAVVAFRGSTHMSRGDHRLFVFARTGKEDSPWRFERHVELPAAPVLAVLAQRDEIYLVLENGNVVKVSREDAVVPIYQSLYKDLTAESLSIIDQELYVAFGHYVAEIPLDPKKGSPRLLAPPNCARLAVKNEKCVCTRDEQSRTQ